jgi:hypothetical protein
MPDPIILDGASTTPINVQLSSDDGVTGCDDAPGHGNRDHKLTPRLPGSAFTTIVVTTEQGRLTTTDGGRTFIIDVTRERNWNVKVGDDRLKG